MKKRIVIKVGSHVLSEHGTLCDERMDALCGLIAELMDVYDVILVSSAAISAGQSKIDLKRDSVVHKQILAAVGQPHLMATYEKKMSVYAKKTAQLLLNAADFDSKHRSTHAKNLVFGLLELGILPIINENDATATAEIVYGDNDRLSADAALCFDAYMLVMLSDIDGYYDSNPSQNKNAKILPVVNTINKAEIASAGGAGSEHGTGGIATKLMAASMLLAEGKKMFLASGFDLSAVRSFLLDGKQNGGTIFEN
ncbi:glutamate 5-kinase [Campylobacter sp.]|uniref:glutamate 5-kinase n=1 Tax=Campylobacter sp. TaxID=205 RepID=UPI002A529AD7|nr:glutamate 5-kinase [Campylobacter sp.]MDD7090815.1 glutamate 5-kinase [Campylobacteraceae bacterium]MDY5285119.1 glutamate 5-kinase [Campylobacter sp.]